MKLLVFCPYYPPHLGGLEQYAHQLHLQLYKLGHKITVITPALPNQSDYQDGPINVLRFPAWEIVYNYPLPKFWSPKFWQLLTYLYHQDFDIIFSVTRFFFTSPMAGIWSRLKSIPWVHIEHGSDYVTSTNLIVKFTSRLVDHTIGRYVFTHSTINVAPSNSAAKFINHFDSRDVPIIYRGLDYSLIDSIKPALIPPKYANYTIVTFTGRFITGKGINYLISAAQTIKTLPFIIFLAGQGAEEQKLKKQVADLDLSEIIVFLGHLSPTKSIALIKSSDIIVNPSLNEGLPTSILEAAACNKAVIATDVGGTREIVTHNSSALIIPSADPEALAKAITKLIDSPTLRSSLGQMARTSVRKNFDWDTAAQHYNKLICHLPPTRK